MNITQTQKQNFAKIRQLTAPDSGWVKTNKSLLMSQIANSVGKETSQKINFDSFRVLVQIFVSRRLSYALKPVMTFLLILAVAVGGWSMSVSASFDSLPGEFLWNVKLAGEKTELAVASVTATNGEKVKIHLKHAEKRANEISEVAKQKDNPDSSKNTETAVKELQKSLKSANDNIGLITDNQPDTIVEMVKDVKETTTNISNKLDDSLEVVIKVVSEEASKGVVESKKMAEEVNLHAVEVALTDNQNNVDEKVKQEVKNIVQEKMDVLVNDLADEKAKMVDLVNKVNSTSTEPAITANLPVIDLSQSKTITSTEKLTSTSSVAQPILPSITNNGIVDEAVKKVNETSVTVQNTVEEGNKLIASDNLLEAVKIIKQLNETAKDIKETMIEVTKAVNSGNVLPAVQATDAPNPLNANVSTDVPSSTTTVIKNN